MTTVSVDPSAAYEDADILIVGAGMAGLYAAFRLLQAGRSVRIVEALDRTGGRLDTDHVVINGAPVHTEEGGMRFMDTQAALMALLHELGLRDQVGTFPMGGPHNIYYLRGRRFTFGDAKADPSIWSTLYHLDDGSKGKQPGDILMGIRNAILQENGQDPQTWQSTPDNWTEFRLKYTYRGIPTYRWGFWALLEDHGLSADCIQMLYQSSGFIAPYDQLINAGSAFQLLADFVDPNFISLRSGYSLLPQTLEANVRGMGGRIDLQREVRGFERDDDGTLRVAVRAPDGSGTVIRCRELILAVTQLALQRMIPYVPLFRETPSFLRDVETVADMPLGKINLYYDHNWWTPRLGISSGGSFTDLPLAQFYCFEQSAAPNDPAAPNAITLYTDYYRCNFWTELQRIGEPYRNPAFPQQPPHTVAASTFVVAAATRQMKEMFGLDDIPLPVLTTYKSWDDPRMGDGDHSWCVGAIDTDVRARLTSPFRNVHVCGESYSDDQAWVNGALRSVDQMLTACFGTKSAATPAIGAPVSA